MPVIGSEQGGIRPVLIIQNDVGNCYSPRYIVDSQIDNHEKYYFIREQESQDIVLLPSKYLMHKKRSKLSPNTIRRSAGAISYYLNYMRRIFLPGSGRKRREVSIMSRNIFYREMRRSGKI